MTAWEVDGAQIVVPDGNTKWSVYDHSQISMMHQRQRMIRVLSMTEYQMQAVTPRRN